MNMHILKVIALLLDYPGQALTLSREALALGINLAHELSPAQRTTLQALLDELTCDNQVQVQARYQGLFEHEGGLSLRLFEQTEFDAWDQGWALLGLLARYQAAGFAIAAHEQPDYIPLYLQYLATRDELTARDGLADVAHLLALLAARLEARDSPYAACVRVLLQIAGVHPQEVMELARERVVAEPRHDALVAAGFAR